MKRGFDYIGNSVVYFCHDGQGKFIMSKRSENSRDEKGRWDIGGGGVEFGDPIEDTLRKEIREEYCTEVVSFEFLGYRDVHRIIDGQQSHWIALDFKVLVKPELVKNGEPHKFNAVEWFTLGTVPGPEHIHTQLPTFLNKYAEHLN